MDPNGLAASLKACVGEGDPVSAAANAAALAFSAIPDALAPTSEILALWVFDTVIAIWLHWPRPVPLIATKILDSALRLSGAARRPRPGDPAWPNAAAGAIALSAAAAPDLAAELARRSNTLIAVAPKLRSKPAQKIAELMLAQDCVSPAEAARHAPMTGRAARRLFDQLVALGAARELSGRLTFRLYAYDRRCAPSPTKRRRKSRRRAFRLAAGRALARMDAARRGPDLRLAKTRGPRDARPPGRRRLPVRRSDRRPHPRTARPPLRSHPRRRRLCAAHQNPRRPGDPRRPSRPLQGRPGQAHADGDLCLDGDFLFAAGDAWGEISKLAGREISRDVVASLKRHGLIDGAIRVPQPGAPFAYVTTRKFLEAFGFATLRDLPDIERLKAEGSLRTLKDDDLDDAFAFSGV
jgi:hypothetical protein